MLAKKLAPFAKAIAEEKFGGLTRLVMVSPSCNVKSFAQERD
jgi:hypothetical protein